MNFLQKFRDFISQPTHSRTLGLVGILAFVGIISLTVIVAQQQQNLKQKANKDDAACKDIETLDDCNSLSDFKINQSNFSCSSENKRCQIDNAIYECQKPQGGSDDD